MNTKQLSIIVALMLLLAIPSGWWPYGYYVLLRWVVFIGSIIISHGFYKSKLSGWVLVFGAIAFLFNPIMPIYLNKSSWVAIDFITMILFLVSAYSPNKNEK